MALAVEQKTEVITKYRIHKTDSGSPEVQVALLSQRISSLTEHLKGAQEGPSLRAWFAHDGVPPPPDVEVLERSQSGTLQNFDSKFGHPPLVTVSKGSAVFGSACWAIAILFLPRNTASVSSSPQNSL